MINKHSFHYKFFCIAVFRDKYGRKISESCTCDIWQLYELIINNSFSNIYIAKIIYNIHIIIYVYKFILYILYEISGNERNEKNCLMEI